MPSDNEFLIPEDIDEQIDSLAHAESHEPIQPVARIISHLQQYYRKDVQQETDHLDRAWKRIVESYQAAQQRSQGKDKIIKMENYQNGQQNSHTLRKKRTLIQQLGLLAAVLIMALLVGSLAVVLNATHQRMTAPQPSNTLGAAQLPPSTFGKLVYTTPGNSAGFSSLAWSPDSQRVASLTDSVRIWDATTGKHLIEVPLSNVVARSLAWSPNSQMLAIGTENSVILVNGSTGAIIRTYPVNTPISAVNATSGPYLSGLLPTSGGQGVRDLAWSSDGSQIALAVSFVSTGQIEVLNVQTGAQVYSLPEAANRLASTLAWSSDGMYMAANVISTNSNNAIDEIWVWKTSTRQVVFKQAGTDNTSEQRVAWQPNSDNLAFGNSHSSLMIWNVATNHLVKQFQRGADDIVAWSPDGMYLASTGSGAGVSIINVQSGQTVVVINDFASVLAWSPNGKYIASGEGGTQGTLVARVWTAE